MKQYSKMKDSGIEWIGKIPEDWTVKKIKFEFDIQTGKTLQGSNGKIGETLVPYLTTSNVFWEKIVTDDLPQMWATPQEVGKYRVMKGDLLVCEGGEGGRSAIIEDIMGDCITQNHVHRLRPKKNSKSKFLMFVLETIKESKWFIAITSRVTISNLPSLTLGNLKIPSPPESEQENLIKFLENSILKIDKEISQNQKLINLINEKRKAIINQAVTRGLDPTVPMKDSGIEWIGNIPEHWNYSQIHYLLSQTISYGVLVPDDDSGGVPMIRSGELESPGGIERNLIFISKTLEEKYKKTRLNGGEILIALVGATIGQLTIATKKYRGYNVSRAVGVIKLKKEHDPRFFKFILQSNIFKNFIEINSMGSAQPVINLESISKLIMAFPPKVEQRLIADFIENKTAKIDLLISKSDLQIEKLQELRKSTISEAVTGKIDVLQEVIV